MSAPGVSFAAGGDDRRNRAGRYPSGAGLTRLILRELGRDAPAIVSRVATLARSGDDQAVIAAACLIAAVVQEKQP